MDIEKAITEGIVFKGGKSPSGKQEDKVKTKAKKKSYNRVAWVGSCQDES